MRTVALRYFFNAGNAPTNCFFGFQEDLQNIDNTGSDDLVQAIQLLDCYDEIVKPKAGRLLLNSHG
jgi:hypothetical protein